MFWYLVLRPLRGGRVFGTSSRSSLLTQSTVSDQKMLWHELRWGLFLQNPHDGLVHGQELGQAAVVQEGAVRAVFQVKDLAPVAHGDRALSN